MWTNKVQAIGNFSVTSLTCPAMANHHELTNFIWQIADLLRGPYRPPQYERVMLPMTVLRRFDCVLAPTKAKVLAEHEKRKGGKLNDDALDRLLEKETVKLDALRTATERTIRLLEERRAALIAAAATGKLVVSHAA